MADGKASEPGRGVRAAYDVVAREYDKRLGDELDGKPLDRGVLTAFLELAGPGTIADVGCGPGHITRFLAARHTGTIGLDLSPGMIAVARERAPELQFTIASMLDLPADDQSWAGALALYSIIHLSAEERAIAWSGFARVIRPGGWLLIAFHVDSPEFATGEVNHLTEWFGEAVDLDGHFLDPDLVSDELRAAGFTLTARLDREHAPGLEYPSRRSYLLSQRDGP